MLMARNWGFETERSRNNAKAEALIDCAAQDAPGARRRPGNPKQEVEGWKANPPAKKCARNVERVSVVLYHGVGHDDVKICR